MTLTVSTVAPTLRLTTRSAVKTELGITASTDDALFDTLIDQASSAIVAYCGRPFARESYTETLPGFGSINLQLARTPVVSVSSVSDQDGNVITDSAIGDADRGWLYRRLGWAWSAQAYGGLGAGGAFLDLGTPLANQEEPHYSVAYVAGYILPAQFVTGTTISAANADSSFNDSAAGFPALLKAGDIVETSGFANAANNGRHLVSGTPTTSKIVTTSTLTTEAAGPSVTVKFRPPSAHRPFDDVEKACIETVKSFYLSRTTDSNLIEKQAGPMRLRYAEDKAGAPGLPATCVGLLRPWVRAA